MIGKDKQKMNDEDEENIYELHLSTRELNIVIMAMSASQVPMHVQEEAFELIEKLRRVLGEST